MINTLLFDFSRVLLFPKDKNYTGKVNDLYREIIKNPSYKFFDYFTLNKGLLNYIRPLTIKYTLALFTTEIVQNDKAIKKYIDKIFFPIFSAKELGLSKRDTKAYELIAKRLKVPPKSILFIDDTKVNLEAAAQSGLHTLHFLSNEKLFKDLHALLRS